MKTKILLFISLLLCGINYDTALAQTGYGNLLQGNTGAQGGPTNSFFGSGAGLNNTAIKNTFVGYQSGISNTTGDQNTASGYRVLYKNTTGHRNTAFGTVALHSNTTGYRNTASGYSALYYNTTGSYNAASGYYALRFNTTGHRNTASGSYALYSNTIGYQNTATGSRVLYSNTTGYRNTASGTNALYANTTGYYNTAFGSYTLYSNTTGRENTATGSDALRSNTTGRENTATGSDALRSNTTGGNNTATGYSALNKNTTGYYNTAFGSYALRFNTTGYLNTASGFDALRSNTTGWKNTAFGCSAGPFSGGLSNTTALGYDATPTASNQARIGNANVASIGGYANWSNLSDGRFKKDIQEDIPGLGFITQLRPVSYDLDRDKLSNFLGREKESSAAPAVAVSQTYPRELGFIAQEVEQLLNENNYTRIGIETPQNENDHYSIRYAEFVVPLVKAVQEQQKMIEEQQKTVEEQQKMIDALREELSASVSPVDSENAFGATNTQKKSGGFVLGQNAPNPFHQNTTIRAEVPESVRQAKIVIYNMNGTELESYDLNGRGEVSVEVSGNRFKSGMYLYALLADGRLIDTKRMVLTK